MEAEGMSVLDRTDAFPERIYLNQEDRQSLSKRVMDGIEKINELYKGKKIILVAHCAVINTILANLSNGVIGSGKTHLVNACISNIEYYEKGWKIRDYNQINHLSL